MAMNLNRRAYDSLSQFVGHFAFALGVPLWLVAFHHIFDLLPACLTPAPNADGLQ